MGVGVEGVGGREGELNVSAGVPLQKFIYTLYFFPCMSDEMELTGPIQVCVRCVHVTCFER